MKGILRKAVSIATAVFTGVCMFILLLSFSVNSSLLRPEYHKELFQKNNIYEETQQVLRSSMKDFVNNLKQNSPSEFQQISPVFSVLEKSLTPEMIQMNLDNMREGIFQYFQGKQTFLPDIYLSQDRHSPAEGESPSTNPKDALTKIDKISLNAILLYINRSDITDTLFQLKFIYYLFSILPSLFLLFSLLLLFGGIFACASKKDYIRWSRILLSVFSILTLLSGLGLILYSRRFLPWEIAPVSMSIPLRGDIIMSYLRDCLTPLSFTLLISGGVSAVLWIGLFFIPWLVPKHWRDHIQAVLSVFSGHRKIKTYLFLVISLFLVFSIFMKVSAIRNDFDRNDFSTALARLSNTHRVVEVISAKSDGIYGLEVKLEDGKTKNPISLAKINISGHSNSLEKDINESAVTDYGGTAKFLLDKGTFRLSLLSGEFPAGYQIPSPFFFNLTSPGTTRITLDIDQIPDSAKPKWGIGEVEVLDESNKPIAGLGLTIESPIFAPGYPNNLFSYTNEEGIAVFKLYEGNYKLGFLPSTLPAGYKLPSSIDVSIQYNSVNRYSLRLVAVHK